MPETPLERCKKCGQLVPQMELAGRHPHKGCTGQPEDGPHMVCEMVRRLSDDQMLRLFRLAGKDLRDVEYLVKDVLFREGT